MEQRRITMSDIKIGKPLPCDVYGEGKQLLLRKGHVVANTHQIQELVARGLFVDAADHEAMGRRRHDTTTQEIEIPSVYRMVNAATKRLEKLLFSLRAEPDFPAKILEVATVLNNAIKQNPDIPLACIILNQSGSHYSIRHCIDTAVVATLVARTMNKTPEEIQIMVAAALTMNVGMLRIQDGLQEKTQPLTEKEAELVKAHPTESVNLLKLAGVDNADWLSHVALHHALDDDTGYPAGTTNLSQNTKILTFADHYCACVSGRKYRNVMLPTAALRDVLIHGGKPRDPMLAAYFIRELGTYPPGTFVKLANGELAVVTRKGHTPTTPIVHAIIGPRGAPLSFPIQRDTGKPLFAVLDAVLEEPSVFRFSMHQLWGAEAAT